MTTIYICWCGYFFWFGCGTVSLRPTPSIARTTSSNDTFRSVFSCAFFLSLHSNTSIHTMIGKCTSFVNTFDRTGAERGYAHNDWRWGFEGSARSNHDRGSVESNFGVSRLTIALHHLPHHPQIILSSRSFVLYRTLELINKCGFICVN